VVRVWHPHVGGTFRSESHYFQHRGSALLRPLLYKDPRRIGMLFSGDPACDLHEGRVSLLDFGHWTSLFVRAWTLAGWPAQHQNEIRTMEAKHLDERRFRCLPHLRCAAIARIEERRLGVYWRLAGRQNGNPGLTARERRQGYPPRFSFPRQNFGRSKDHEQFKKAFS